MGVVQKKFSRRHKHKLSAEEKLERDLKDCMKCKYFWGNNNRCMLLIKGCRLNRNMSRKY